MSLTQVHGASTDIAPESVAEPYWNPPKIAAYTFATLATAFGGYELAMALNPSPEALQALSDNGVKAVVYLSGGAYFIGGVGYIATECVNGVRNTLRRLR